MLCTLMYTFLTSVSFHNIKFLLKLILKFRILPYQVLFGSSTKILCEKKYMTGFEALLLFTNYKPLHLLIRKKSFILGIDTYITHVIYILQVKRDFFPMYTSELRKCVKKESPTHVRYLRRTN